MIQFVQEPPLGEPVFFYGYFLSAYSFCGSFVIQW